MTINCVPMEHQITVDIPHTVDARLTLQILRLGVAYHNVTIL
jgi:hypothetical protein